jgi:hypothetical protein
MSIPGFNAEASLGPSTKKYRGLNRYGSFRINSLTLQQYDMEEMEDWEDEMGLEEEEEEEEEL